MKTALITGITGQDGSYLAELLLKEGYDVHGIIRRSSSFNTGRIDHIFKDLYLHHGDLTDGSSLSRLLGKIVPDEIYNLGAQSHVRVSFDCPEYTCDVDGLGTLRILETIKGSHVKLYQASSSEMFGKVVETPQKETTPFYPRSPYGCAKVFSYWLVRNYREAHNLFASNGILFNHESPRRGETFVTRKIARAVARISWGLQDKIVLGNLDAKRDWGHAEDYVDGMFRILQHHEPDDFVLATGETHSVREFLDAAFEVVGIDDWTRLVEQDPKYFRPTEVDLLLGDATKARRILKWKPKWTFEALVEDMVRAELDAISPGEKR